MEAFLNQLFIQMFFNSLSPPPSLHPHPLVFPMLEARGLKVTWRRSHQSCHGLFPGLSLTEQDCTDLLLLLLLLLLLTQCDEREISNYPRIRRYEDYELLLISPNYPVQRLTPFAFRVVRWYYLLTVASRTDVTSREVASQ